MKALDVNYAPKTRKDLIDYDYVNKLSDDEKRWLAQFTDEWVGAAIAKTKKGKVKHGHLHNTEELAKDCFDRNNRRNNDVLGVTKAVGLLTDIDNYLDEDVDGWYITNKDLTEDAVIGQYEQKNSEDSVLSLKEFLNLRDKLTPEAVAFYTTLYNLK